MSDDDRMDRAERIRKMREGNRAETDGAAADDASTDGEQRGAAASAPGKTAPADDQRDSADGPTDESAAGGAEPAPEPEEPVTDEGASDAMAAAQRAAQSAAEVTGGPTDTTAQTTGTLQQAEPPTDTPAQSPAGVELPDQQAVEAAMAASDAAETEGAASAADDESTQSEELVRVLEFALGEEYYCLDIEYVEEIVKRDDVTRVPNTDAYVEGVVDLRGQITTILDPKSMMDIDDEGDQNLVVVFDPEMFEEQGAVGWIVDEVRQVSPVAESEVNSPPVDADYINGVVDREDRDQFVIWVEPDDALAAATAEDD